MDYSKRFLVLQAEFKVASDLARDQDKGTGSDRNLALVIALFGLNLRKLLAEREEQWQSTMEG